MAAAAPWITSQFEDFVTSLGESVDSVASTFRIGISKAGQLLANAPALDYSARFALHMQDQFSLSDNSSVYVTGEGYTVDGYGPLVLTVQSGGQVITLGSLFDYNTLYTCNGVNFWADYSASTGQTRMNFYRNGVLYSGASYDQSFPQVNKFSFIRNTSLPGTDSVFVGNIRTDGYVGVYIHTPFSLSEFFDSSFLVLTSGTIDIPTVGDYSGQDGLLIDGFGSWGDSLQDIWDKLNSLAVPDSTPLSLSWDISLVSDLVDALVSEGVLTTENSPGIFLPLGTLPELHFPDLWHYVSDWVSSFSSGLSLISGIMFAIPASAALLALIVIMIVLSVWRLLRSA